jgi:hypothetical protein
VPDYADGRLHERTVSSIINAWNNSTVIDYCGRPWLNSEALYIVLRTTRANAAYMAAGLEDNLRHFDGNNTYIKGEGVCFLLDSMITNARSLLRENYVKYSQLLYIAIRDCSRARELRAEHYESTKKILKNLKANRLRLSIEYDELTGLTLNKLSCEFSHIRSVSLYPDFSAYVENGLLVNKEVHNIITSSNILDENQLLDLCYKNGWSTAWYQAYLDFLNNF